MLCFISVSAIMILLSLQHRLTEAKVYVEQFMDKNKQVGIMNQF